MAKKIKIDEFHIHEVVHTTFIMSDLWDNHILDHPLIEQNLKFRKEARKISDAIGAFYQLVGAERKVK